MTENTADTAKRQMLTMRVTQRLKDRIAATADANGRSVSQEIESRLERTLYEDDALGDAEQAGFLRWLATIMDAASRQGHTSWLNDPEIFDQVRSAAILVFDAYRPQAVDIPSLDDMSAAGRAILEAWERDVAIKQAATAPFVQRATQLHMKKEATGLSEDEQSEMDAALSASRIEPVPTPNLDDADSAIHAKWGRRRQIMKRVETTLVQLIISINDARGNALWQ
jgi:hypothetical protein